jgi:cytochrome o ubiquinol oxidase subunit 3
MAMLAANNQNMSKLFSWLAATWLLGFGFLILEVNEFIHFTHEGAGAWDSGAWSAFYGLIGTHGLHVLAGMVWMIVLIFLIRRDGLSIANQTRLACLSLFWHFLDIIWICVFSFVFLMGV